MSSIHPSNCFKGTYKSIAICKMKVFVVFLVCGLQASSNVTKSSVLGVLRNSIFAKNSIRLWDRYFPCEFCKNSKNTFFIEHLWATASVFSYVIGKLNFLLVVRYFWIVACYFLLAAS